MDIVRHAIAIDGHPQRLCLRHRRRHRRPTQLANTWTVAEEVDQSRRRTEAEALAVLIDALGSTWAGMPREYHDDAPHGTPSEPQGFKPAQCLLGQSDFGAGNPRLRGSGRT